MIPFSPHELLGFATDLERYSHRFFTQAFAKVHGKAQKDLFRCLTVAEQEHLVVVTGLQSELKDTDSQSGASFGVSGHRAQAMAHGPFLRHCVDFSVHLGDAKDASHVFDLALKLEKNAIDFYSALLNVLHSPSAQQVLNRLLSDHHQHLQHVGEHVHAVTHSA